MPSIAEIADRNLTNQDWIDPFSNGRVFSFVVIRPSNEAGVLAVWSSGWRFPCVFLCFHNQATDSEPGARSQPAAELSLPQRSAGQPRRRPRSAAVRHVHVRRSRCAKKESKCNQTIFF